MPDDVIHGRDLYFRRQGSAELEPGELDLG